MLFKNRRPIALFLLALTQQRLVCRTVAKMARLRSGTAALFLCALLAPSLAAEQKPLATSGNKNYHHGNPLSEGFGRYVTDLMEEWKAPGLSVAVLDGDQVYMQVSRLPARIGEIFCNKTLIILYLQGYGFAKLPDTPVTPETLFLGGSTTKAHVAATVAQLIAKGDHADVFRLGWSTPISSIIRDDFVMYDEWSTVHLTLEDAVSHRTGLPRHGMSWAGTADPKDVRNRHRTNQDTVRNLRHLAPTAEPRTRFQYCNLMYIVLSHVIETVTKSWVGDVLREAIWQPLGMTSTFLSYHDARKSGNVVATGYWWDHEAQEYVAVEEDPVQFSSGAGAIITNAVDYAKWVKCLVYEAAPFSRATHEDIRRPRMLEIPVPAAGFDVSNYGLGWERTTLHGQAVYKHNGGTQHFGTNVLWMPDVKFGVVAFANTATVSNVIEELLTLRLAEDRLGIPQSERRDYSVEYEPPITPARITECTFRELILFVGKGRSWIKLGEILLTRPISSIPTETRIHRPLQSTTACWRVHITTQDTGRILFRKKRVRFHQVLGRRARQSRGSLLRLVMIQLLPSGWSFDM